MEPYVTHIPPVEKPPSVSSTIKAPCIPPPEPIRSIIYEIPPPTFPGQQFNDDIFPSQNPLNLDASPKEDDNDESQSNAFMFFEDYYKPVISKQYTNLPSNEISSIIEKMWNELSDEEKKPYFDMVEELEIDSKIDKKEKVKNKLITDKKMSPINRQKAPKDRVGDSKKRNKKDPRAPKRNMSAFLFFSRVRRHDVKKAHPHLSFAEIAKVLSEMWRLAPQEEKHEYIEKARMDKLRYFREKKAYDDSQPRESPMRDKEESDSLDVQPSDLEAGIHTEPSSNIFLNSPYPLPSIQHTPLNSNLELPVPFEEDNSNGVFSDYSTGPK